MTGAAFGGARLGSSGEPKRSEVSAIDYPNRERIIAEQ
jgi:hypothetical protein